MNALSSNNCADCGHAWSPDNKQLFCRRNPPQVYSLKDAPRSCFPPVLPEWTCGEWKTRIVLAH